LEEEFTNRIVDGETPGMMERTPLGGTKRTYIVTYHDVISKSSKTISFDFQERKVYIITKFNKIESQAHANFSATIRLALLSVFSVGVVILCMAIA
jgi:hypothetical protein